MPHHGLFAALPIRGGYHHLAARPRIPEPKTISFDGASI